MRKRPGLLQNYKVKCLDQYFIVYNLLMPHVTIATSLIVATDISTIADLQLTAAFATSIPFISHTTRQCVIYAQTNAHGRSAARGCRIDPHLRLARASSRPGGITQISCHKRRTLRTRLQYTCVSDVVEPEVHQNDRS